LLNGQLNPTRRLDDSGKKLSGGFQLRMLIGKANTRGGVEAERSRLNRELLREWNDGRFYCAAGIENKNAQQE
jgi:hypothetical protein